MCLYETVCKAHKSVLTGKHWCIYLDVEYSNISVCCLYEGCDVFSACKIFPLFLLNMHIYSYKLWLPATLLHIFNCKNIYPTYALKVSLSFKSSIRQLQAGTCLVS